MLYGELPKFNAKLVWEIDQRPDGLYEVGPRVFGDINDAYRFKGEAAPDNLEFLNYLHEIPRHGLNTLEGETEANKLKTLSDLNEQLLSEVVCALLYTDLKVWGRPECGRLGRIAYLRGFVLPKPNAPSQRLWQVLSDHHGKLGRRYDRANVMFEPKLTELSK